MRFFGTIGLPLLSLLTPTLAVGRSLSDFLARRDYDAAIIYYRHRLKKKPNDVAAMKNLARVYDHAHIFDSSLYWWEAVLAVTPRDDSAILGRWQTLARCHEKDSMRLRSTKELIRQEAFRFLSETTAANLTMAWKGLSISDTDAATQVAWLLAHRFPDSPAGDLVIGEAFYDSLYLQGVWYNDTLKVPLIRRFLSYFPESRWRATFYTFLISSLYGLRDTAQILAVTREMTNENPLDPFSWRYAASILNRLQTSPELAEAYARRAIALEPTAKKPLHKSAAEWELEYRPLYGLARLALAEALKAQGKVKEAECWVKQALSNFQWDPNLEATPGPFYCLLGELYEAQYETLSALRAYACALQAGDSRYQWSARADSGLKRLGVREPHEQVELGRELLGHVGATFTDVTEAYGLYLCRETRVAWGDYNLDGYDDLLLSGCRLFRNDSGNGFTEVTDSSGLSGAKGRGGIWADYNNDGWLDFYMTGSDTNDRLWQNEGGRFRDVTAEVGYPSDPYPTEGIACADYNNDGWVDIYSANYEFWHAEQRRYTPDYLWCNKSGLFRNVTESAGVVPPYGENLAGRGVNWGDYDNDGWQDCYVSNYRLCENFLWHNNGDGTFINSAGREGVAGEEVKGFYGHTIGSAWGDYDNDGDLDLFTANLAHPRYIEFSNRSQLYENRGPRAYPRFADVRAKAGIAYEETHSNPAWADVDNDGDLDLYITSIYESRRSFLYENKHIDNSVLQGISGFWSRLRKKAANLAKWRRYVPKFLDITWLSGTRAFNGWGCAFSDFDKDGDMDLVVGSSGGLRLFRNDTRNGNYWLQVTVVGSKANRTGIGCRVIVLQANGRRQIREVEGGHGTTSQNSLVQHFGLGKDNRPVTVEVRFSPNSSRRIKDVRPNQLVVVTE